MTSEPIPFLDLARLHRQIRPELDAAFDRVLAASAFVGAKAVASFEDSFARAHGRRYGIGCGSGTDALMLALVASGIGRGDEVVVPAMTFVATAEAVVHAGATPVLADVDRTTLLLNEDAVSKVRTRATRAVIPVHLYGHVAPFAAIKTWRDDGLIVIEDAAQAHLATWESEPVGTAGHAVCFSFYPGKNLGALGDGGCVLTDDEALARRIRTLADHGSAEKYRHEVVGYCSRLDGLQAAALSVKLSFLDGWTEARRAAASRYRQQLPSGVLVPWEDGAVHHLLVARIAGGRRDDVASVMRACGVETGVHYPLALTQQRALEPWYRDACPAAELAAAEVLSLPLDPLMTNDQIDRACEALTHALAAQA